jgi:hypothetical protein
MLQTRRWLGDRRLVVVADSSFAALELIAAVRRHAWLITRFRLDASLFDPAPERRPGQKGRPRLKGKAQPKPNAILAESENRMDPDHDGRMIWWPNPRAGLCLRHLGLVLQWPAARPDPLGPGPRSFRRA